MCGITAIHAYHHAALPVDRDELMRISAHQQSRGPDGAGSWLDARGRIGLAHQRLSIIDPDPRAAQPMMSADAAAVISFNGEIYNFRELRAALQRDGQKWRTQSDTEVLVELYRREGELMLQRLRGMFALAIWDARRGALLLARDPYGIKPLYYADDGWTVRVASQVKALLASGRVSTMPEPAGQVGFALLGSVPEPFTMYQEIRALPAGHLTWVDEAGVQLPRAHWLIADGFRDARAGDEESTLAALRDSVRAHLVADVRVGVFLSAGVDSSALLGAMADQSHESVCAITIGFDEFKGKAEDEVPLAAEMAQRYGARHVVRRVAESEFHSDLPRILQAMDQPSLDGFNTWFAAKAAHEQGLKVMLSGVGADELFGGYNSFIDIPRWRRTFALTSAIKPLGTALRLALAPLLPRLGLSPKAAGLPELGGTWAGAWLLRRGVYMPWELSKLLPTDVVQAGLYRLQWQQHIHSLLKPALPDAHRKVALMESALYLRNQLLRDADWASMAQGVELRTPLVDANLLRAVAGHAARIGARGGKKLLARMPRQALPDHLVQRAKTGFGTPMAQWITRSDALSGWRRHPFLQNDRVQASRRLVAAMLSS